MEAAKADRESHQAGIPAIAKLRMLDRVMDTLQKCVISARSLHLLRMALTINRRQYNTAVMDQDLLGACKIWLEPLDAKSLPALNIQTAFFEHFERVGKMRPVSTSFSFSAPQMNIDTETLRESGLGKIVLFYTKCPRVIPRIARIASNLVDTWTRPILKRSASYFDKVVPVASREDMENVRMPIPKLAAILQDLRMRDDRVGDEENGEDGERARRKTMRVSIPERSAATYTVAPSVSASLVNRDRGPQDDALASRRNNKEMLKRLQRKTEKGGKV